MAQAKRKIIWAQPALDDLDEIAAYIALDNVDAAAELIGACLDAVERLIRFPESGRFPPELKDRRYRELIVAPCRIIYRTEGQAILIVHVMRGEQRLRRKHLL